MGAGRRIATLALAAGFCLATAQDTPEIGGRRSDTPEGFADADRSCGEWTDGCTICVRRANGAAGCSTPGIACQPKALTCSRKVDPTGTRAE